jgi:hypothetical protein
MLKTREGIFLLQYGISPYKGDSCHIPPLWLAMVAPWVQHKALCVLPNMVCDVVAAAALLLAAAHLFGRTAAPASSTRGGCCCSFSICSCLVLVPMVATKYGVQVQQLSAGYVFAAAHLHATIHGR